MNPNSYSSVLLRKLLQNFDKTKNNLPNEKYLNECLEHLNRMAGIYKLRSQQDDLIARHRARARDLEQNAIGLLNGIKFALAFMNHKEGELDN